MVVVPAFYSQPDDENIILRFNHTKARELFEVQQWVTKTPQKFYNQFDRDTVVTNEIEGTIQKTTGCTNGDFAADPINKYMYLCLNGKDRIENDAVMIDGIFCRDSCPTSGLSCTREGFTRLYSAQAQWTESLALRKLPSE